MRLRLIEDWRGAWRFWSVRLNALGSTVLAAFAVWPESTLILWSYLPEEARAILPTQIAMLVPIGLFVAAMVARLIKQRRKGESDAAEPAQ